MSAQNKHNITVTFLIGNSNPSSASFNRFFAIARATSMHQNVRVAFIRPLSNRTEMLKMMDIIGSKELIAYQKKSQAKQGLKKFKDIILSFKKIKSYFQSIKESQNSKEILFLYSTNLIDYFIYRRLANKYKFKLVTERNEYPKLFWKKSIIKYHLFRFLILPNAYKVFDGIILMTDFLIKFYTPYLNKNACIVKIPMTVDFDRFNNKVANQSSDYIFYAGSLSEKKDGVETLIKAFKKVSKENSKLTLKIAGGNLKEIDDLKNRLLITAGDRIEFLGKIPRQEIPYLLQNAKLQVLPRPRSKQAEGGFPTKLGEYLASGKPVIATPVGEIPNYLQHNQDIIFCYKLTPENLTKLILDIFNDYDKYSLIGVNGKENAKKNFNLNNYTEKLSNFYRIV